MELLPLPANFKDKATWFLRFDLARARVVGDDGKEHEILYRDASGRVCDVHSLRSSYITGLVLTGVGGGVVQHLARHSDPKLTARYTRLRDSDARRAVELLPSLSGEPATRARATGTDGCLAAGVASSGRQPVRRVDSSRHPDLTDGAESASSHSVLVTAVGIEPTT